MNYEQKYNEALERAKEFYNDKDNIRYANAEGMLEDIFPELKESEDEKVRKELITHCRNTRCVTEEGAERIAKWIDWLEKQGEQKHFDYESADIQQKDFAPKETVKEAESNLTPLERKVKDILFSFHINADDGISFDGTMAIVHNLITLCQQEQKPAWSEEDRRNLQGIIDEIEANKNNAPDYDLATYNRFLSWLKSLKQRIGGKP